MGRSLSNKGSDKYRYHTLFQPPFFLCIAIIFCIQCGFPRHASERGGVGSGTHGRRAGRISSLPSGGSVCGCGTGVSAQPAKRLGGLLGQSTEARFWVNPRLFHGCGCGGPEKPLVKGNFRYSGCHFQVLLLTWKYSEKAREQERRARTISWLALQTILSYRERF